MAVCTRGNILLFSLLLVVITALPSLSALPGQINYQGKLNTTAIEGGPVPDGDYTMRFYLLDAATGGNQLWNGSLGEEQLVTVTGGLYNIQLGADEPMDSTLFDGGSVWLEVAIYNGSTWETLSPRQQITSTAYAFKAGDADLLNGQHASEIIDAAADEVRTPISTCGVTISNPGSYYLTGNLLTCAEYGIIVDSDDVTIDLKGFILSGSGLYTGIYSKQSNIEVRNGTIRNFNYGISFTNSSNHPTRIINVRAIANLNGFSVGRNSLVQDCTVADNSSTGILTYQGSTVNNNEVYNNGGTGIQVGEGSIISNNTVYLNGGIGIIAFHTSILNNNASKNGSWGVSSGGYCRITANVISNNNEDGTSGLGGLRIASRNFVKENSFISNSQNNIVVSSGSASVGNIIEDNLLTDSINGILFLYSGSFYANNRAFGNTTDYNLNGTTQTDGGGNISF